LKVVETVEEEGGRRKGVGFLSTFGMTVGNESLPVESHV
jgi:hypothetical protein